MVQHSVLSGWEVGFHGLPLSSSLTLRYYLTSLCSLPSCKMRVIVMPDKVFLMTKWHKICKVLRTVLATYFLAFLICMQWYFIVLILSLWGWVCTYFMSHFNSLLWTVFEYIFYFSTGVCLVHLYAFMYSGYSLWHMSVYPYVYIYKCHKN